MTTLAWHFVVTCNGQPVLRDGTPLPAVGEWLTHHGPLVLCTSGLHASVRAIDALRYAPGETLCRVECDGEMLDGGDKLVCRQRRVLWSADATDVLRAFARRCALDVVHLWRAPAVVKEYLDTGREDLRSAARAAARAAAGAAAGDAAWAAAWAAAGVAAWAAAGAAAWAAAGDAVGDAAWARYGLWLEDSLSALEEK